MKLRRSKCLGGLYLLPGRAHWMLAEWQGNELDIKDGDVLDLPDGFPPDPEIIGQFLKRVRANWHLVCPLRHRSGLAHLPPLDDAEIERGMRWEARKCLRLGDDDAAVDFERFSSSRADDPEQTVLLVALPRATVREWLQWIRELPRRPERLEPAFPACLRSLTWLSCKFDDFAPPLVYIHGDDGGSSLAVRSRDTVFGVRRLPPRSLEPLNNRWVGEDGIRLLRETLLYIEDRHPRLELQGLVGLGALDPDWLAEAADAAQLDLLPSPPPPPGLPRGALATEAHWMIPLGTLLGTEP